MKPWCFISIKSKNSRILLTSTSITTSNELTYITYSLVWIQKTTNLLRTSCPSCKKIIQYQNTTQKEVNDKDYHCGLFKRLKWNSLITNVNFVLFSGCESWRLAQANATRLVLGSFKYSNYNFLGLRLASSKTSTNNLRTFIFSLYTNTLEYNPTKIQTIVL